MTLLKAYLAKPIWATSKMRGNGKTSCSAKRSIGVVDMFAGCGGLSLGWLTALGEDSTHIIAAIDADSRLEDLFAWNYPQTRFIAHRFGNALSNNEAVHIAKKANIAPGDVDVLLAGPPCQTFSAAGKRELSNESAMVFHVCDFVEAMLPRLAIIENVPQFGQVLEGRLAGRVRVRLNEAGYAAAMFRLNAVDFGVPQKRIRCFVVAVRKDLASEGFSPPIGSIDARQASSQPSATAKDFDDIRSGLKNLLVTSRQALDDLPPLESGEGKDEGHIFSQPTSAYQRNLRDWNNRLFNHVSVRHSPELVALLGDLAAGETPQRMKDHPLRRKEYFRAAYARLNPDEPAPTMTTQTHNPGSGRFTHYRDTRTLTVREVARLQGFPDSFRFFGHQETQRRHVGNAVPPPVVRAIASKLAHLL